jgi:hypothetical protein
MATSMAIGMLFLGAGRFTLSTSDSAIAALLISFYPRYPVNAQDNRCHLQAYRHFWLLAVEARLLSVEDIESGESSRMPVEVQLQKAGSKAEAIVSMPCLLPKVQEVKSIQIASDRYFSSKLDLQGNIHHRRAVIETRKLYVKKKAADLSHDEDKWGKSSIRARAGNITAATQLPLAIQSDIRRERRQECEQLRDLIKNNSHDKDICTLIDVISDSQETTSGSGHNEQEGALELFVLQSILECLLQDKLDLLPTMISLYSSAQALLKRGDGNETQTDVFFLKDLQLLKNSMATPLIDLAFVDSLWTLLQDKYIHELKQSQEDSLRTYLSAVSSPSSPHQLACLLIVAEVPPLSILLQVQQLVMAQEEDRSTLEALIQGTFKEVGYDTRVEVIKVLIKAWQA